MRGKVMLNPSIKISSPTLAGAPNVGIIRGEKKFNYKFRGLESCGEKPAPCGSIG